MMNGFGFNTLSGGNTYTGFFAKDKKHGYGVYCWDGKEYRGWWTTGKQDGYGILKT